MYNFFFIVSLRYVITLAQYFTFTLQYKQTLNNTMFASLLNFIPTWNTQIIYSEAWSETNQEKILNVIAKSFAIQTNSLSVTFTTKRNETLIAKNLKSQQQQLFYLTSCKVHATDGVDMFFFV